MAMSISNTVDRVKGKVKDRIYSEIKEKADKSMYCLEKGIDLSAEVSDKDWNEYIDAKVESAVSAAMVDYEVIIKEIMKEIISNAEINVASGDLNLDMVTTKSTIPPMTYSAGAGAAAAPVPTPVIINGNLDDKRVSGTIKKGSIK
ncbi:MAG: hypothetical protein WCY30_00190 [Candidatus Neomarinimicrobiota bacterium]|jgi:hypothetical protein